MVYIQINSLDRWNRRRVEVRDSVPAVVKTWDSSLKVSLPSSQQGYAGVVLPTDTGRHRLECKTWRPSAGRWSEIQ